MDICRLHSVKRCGYIIFTSNCELTNWKKESARVFFTHNYRYMY